MIHFEMKTLYKKDLWLLLAVLLLSGSCNRHAQRVGKYGCSRCLKKHSEKVVVREGGQCDDRSWVLVFEDNFEADQLDTSKWQTAYNWGRTLVGDSEQQYYADSNVETNGGTAKLVARRETIHARAIPYLADGDTLRDAKPNKRTFDYTSGMLFSRQLFGYGRYEIRCKIPKGKGFWPAFWTFGGPGWNEIDVVEFWNEKTRSISTGFKRKYDARKCSRIANLNAHYDYDGDGKSENCSTKHRGPDFSQSFHTFAVVWNRYVIEWYIDGKLKRRAHQYYTTWGRPIDCRSLRPSLKCRINKTFPQQVPHHIIANLAIQARSNSPDQSTPFPSSLEIDYIRYYKREKPK